MINPQSPYAQCKIYEEDYIKKNLQKFTILRMGTICGISTGIRFHTAINKFSYQAALSKPITVWRKLYTKKRPYLVLSDLVKLIEFILFKKQFSGIFDAVSENLAVIDIIKMIKNENEFIKKNLRRLLALGSIGKGKMKHSAEEFCEEFCRYWIITSPRTYSIQQHLLTKRNKKAA